MDDSHRRTLVLQYLSECSNGHLENVKTMLYGRHVNIDDVDEKKRSALHVSVCRNQIQVAQFLLENNINTTLQDTNYNTALHLASITGNSGMVKLILHFAAKNNQPILQKDIQGNTAIDLAGSRMRNILRNNYNSQGGGGRDLKQELSDIISGITEYVWKFGSDNDRNIVQQINLLVTSLISNTNNNINNNNNNINANTPSIDELDGMNKLLILSLVLLFATIANGYVYSASTSSIESSDAATNSSGCALITNCSSCTEDKGCVWCDSSAICSDGTFYGSKPMDTCKDFMWMQCKIQGRYAILIAAGGAAVLLFLFILTICCCCCCGSRKTKVYHIQDEESRGLLNHESRTPVTDARREQMRLKYGSNRQQQNKSNSSWN
ncbi:hypothetical protein DFA_08126 [Cavenderia fasciculata]|uniref:Ankyrin repeat-containing protein n=1 Tax=Cavenderia fasciculata TaxID=261658 RepID=F4Q585_CACFS|nr:uncharacterized protein DFA_08126 [Cavenderia fasciculata]EGG17144.1 hypothetical protein DFA_08126 [Cavenderia fasciculata]|eukprot:XP_004355628.1 hypothetical protein DFA_08126 [Cavenderia fasciculata]